MIWFACKQCGKPMRQPDSSVGSFVFCTCGAGTRVPWESTISPPPEPQVSEPPEPEERRPSRRRSEPASIDPAYCLNHTDIPSEVECEDCKEHFCQACVLQVRGKTLCGPCKNFRLSRLQRPPRVSGLAVVSLILAIMGLVIGGGPLSLCLPTVGQLNEPGLSVFGVLFGFMALLLPAGALLLAFLALGRIERNPRLGGRGLAVTGATTAVIGVVWSLTLIVLVLSKPIMN
jgi:hypothetical protein